MGKLENTLAALVLAGSAGIAAAQTAVVVPDRQVVIVPEQQTVIREYVRKKPLVSLDLPGIDLNIGSPLPQEVELHAIEAPDIAYRYVVIDGRTVLVDPETRQIVGYVD